MSAPRVGMGFAMIETVRMVVVVAFFLLCMHVFFFIHVCTRMQVLRTMLPTPPQPYAHMSTHACMYVCIVHVVSLLCHAVSVFFVCNLFGSICGFKPLLLC